MNGAHSDEQNNGERVDERFVFAIGDPCPFPYPPYPEIDPLGELEPFRRAMWAFMQEHNRWVMVAVGELERTVELDSDIEMVYQELPCAIRCIAGGVAVRVLFAESGFDLIVAPPGTPWEQAFEAEDDFMFQRSLAEGRLTLVSQPADARVVCAIQEWGYRHGSASVTLPATQVIGVLRAFLADLMRRAVEAGYIGAAGSAPCWRSATSSLHEQPG